MVANFNPRASGMGINSNGIGDPGTVFKTKFRWSFEAEGKDCQWKINPHFVKVANRPSISFEEIEVNFLNDKTWVPGKPTWEPITVTFLDSNRGNSDAVISWVSSIYDFNYGGGGGASKKMSSKITGYTGTVVLTLYDGCGTVTESWILKDAWPQASNFNDLDYSSSEIADLEVTLRYSQVAYISGCGLSPIECDCQGCG